MDNPDAYPAESPCCRTTREGCCCFFDCCCSLSTILVMAGLVYFVIARAKPIHHTVQVQYNRSGGSIPKDPPATRTRTPHPAPEAWFQYTHTHTHTHTHTCSVPHAPVGFAPLPALFLVAPHNTHTHLYIHGNYNSHPLPSLLPAPPVRRANPTHTSLLRHYR